MLGFVRNVKLKQAFRNNKRKHAFHRLESMKSVLILFYLKDLEDIMQVVTELKKLNIKTILWTIEDSKAIINQKKNIETAKSFTTIKILENKDFSKVNILSDEVINEFLKLEYDTLIDFSSDCNKDIIYFDYLLALNKAEFCIGCREIDVKNVYDLTVLREKEQKIRFVFDQMKLFLQNIYHQ